MSGPAGRVVLAGGSGFLGRALASYLAAAGREVVILSRTPRASGSGVREVAWDARTCGAWTNELDGAAAVVNLTGRSVDCRYNAANRAAILNSRVDSTRVVGEAIGRCARPPSVWLNASTATVYRHTYDNAWDESGPREPAAEAKDAFSLEVATQWEAAVEQAVTPATRKVMLRTSMVLGLAANSVFPVLRRLVRLGLGGRMGNGRQYVSWIHERDYCRAVEWLLAQEDLAGPVNMTAPEPVPNAAMMRILRSIYHMPIGLPASEWMLEVGAWVMRTETELILKSRRVVPGRLLASGFRFEFPTLKAAFQDLAAAAR